MKQLCLLTLLLLSGNFIYAQNAPDTTGQEKKMGEIIVYSNKFAERINRVAQQVTVIRNREALQAQPNTGEVLQNSGAVFLQKSQQGGGSPVIRGFEASRVLLMVDGVRMNNAIFRTGHLQNIITVDNTILNRIEVLYGPSSTLYGSDALGGVVNLFTRNPVFAAGKKTEVSGNMLFRYTSAVGENRVHADVNIGGKGFASLTSFTYGSFGEMITGKNRSSKYPDFGKRPFYVRTANGFDFKETNTNVNKQVGSAYQQYDLLQKFAWRCGEHVEHLLNIQYSTTGDIPRYDRLSEVNASGVPNFGEWYYGPQKRLLTAYHTNINNPGGFFQQVRSVLSFQNIEESRITRRFNNPVRQNRIERINVWGYTLDMKKTNLREELHLGIDMQFNDLQSAAQGVNIRTGAVSAISTRYPDGKNRMNYVAAYAQHKWKISERWTLDEGLRINFVSLKSRFIDNSIMKFPYTEAEQKHTALTGNIGLVYATPNNWRAALVISSGFRSPNVDDLGKVFDSRPGAVIVPNPDLKPEYTYNGEINFNKWDNNYTIGGSVFYTRFRNGILLGRAQFNGADSIDYDGRRSEVLSNQNKNRAYLYGASINGSIRIAAHTTLSATATYTYGRAQTDSTDIPLDHIPPVFGRAGVKHVQGKWNSECFVLFNGWKKIKDYNPNGEDNPQYATPEGMPSWYTVNLVVGYSISSKILVQLSADNLLDKHYRVFASGISAPGRNIGVSVRAGF
jgi:hemoglobin/transferrin/lactoferrin receptor protein